MDTFLNHLIFKTFNNCKFIIIKIDNLVSLSGSVINYCNKWNLLFVFLPFVYLIKSAFDHFIGLSTFYSFGKNVFIEIIVKTNKKYCL